MGLSNKHMVSTFSSLPQFQKSLLSWKGFRDLCTVILATLEPLGDTPPPAVVKSIRYDIPLIKL